MMLVISGASKGIGKAIVERFAKANYDIVACSRQLNELHLLKKDIEERYKVNVYVQSSDLSIKEDVKVFVDFVKRIGKPIDVLVNNAGMFVLGTIHQEQEGTLEKLIETNLYSAYYLTRGLIDAMIMQKKGHIFNISSIAGISTYANCSSYTISKHALQGFSKCLREEMKPYGIKVTTVVPGATLTNSWAGTSLPPERFCQPKDIAEMVFAASQLSESAVVEEIIIRPQLGDI
ncbi:MAG: SDR family oxidoreductase [Flammeovirgaceae bacterium]|nr:SDR family oxidoreductase [Flammeovirgaceae bacterium]